MILSKITIITILSIVFLATLFCLSLYYKTLVFVQNVQDDILDDDFIEVLCIDESERKPSIQKFSVGGVVEKPKVDKPSDVARYEL